MTAPSLIEKLHLIPHPEGGYYREMYRSKQYIHYEGQVRTASTAIYYLLCNQAISKFHRIDADEIWHAYYGSGIRVHILHNNTYSCLEIGQNLSAGQELQGVVPAGAWFGAELIDPDGYALVGCTVAPAFEFSKFELAQYDHLVKDYPMHQALIKRLT